MLDMPLWLWIASGVFLSYIALRLWVTHMRRPRKRADLPVVPAGKFAQLSSMAVRGVAHRNNDGVDRQDIIAKLRNWDTVALIRESNNPKDRFAVQVCSEYGLIGYIPAEHSRTVFEGIGEGTVMPFASIKKVLEPTEDYPRLGCIIQLYRPRKRSRKSA